MAGVVASIRYPPFTIGHRVGNASCLCYARGTRSTHSITSRWHDGDGRSIVRPRSQPCPPAMRS